MICIYLQVGIEIAMHLGASAGCRPHAPEGRADAPRLGLRRLEPSLTGRLGAGALAAGGALRGAPVGLRLGEELQTGLQRAQQVAGAHQGQLYAALHLWWPRGHGGAHGLEAALGSAWGARWLGAANATAAAALRCHVLRAARLSLRLRRAKQLRGAQIFLYHII